MCGIAGVIAVREDVVRRTLPRMVACQAHRGPDDTGEDYLQFKESFLGLGHRRLSIQDLSAAGHQPMVHPVTGDRIVFNGEIFNFHELRHELESLGETFKGQSDTEVMLQALSRWGTEAMKRFKGMYAFAFYNVRQQQIILARDPLGIKPLYIAQADGAILFASEVRAILAAELVPRRIDRRGAAGLLAYGAVQKPCTIVAGVEEFPPGHFEVIDACRPTRTAPVRFWDFPPPRSEFVENDAVSLLRETLDVAVREHLVANVPVGVFLSSGLDSTIIAGLAARHTKNLRSFTVSFSDAPDLSERQLATETARLFGLEHTNVDITAPDAEAAAITWLAALDQPSIDGMNVYVISRAVRAHGIGVALSGQGGDELFGGYPSFTDVPKLRRLLRPMAWMPAALRGAATAAAGIGQSRSARQKLADMARTDGGILALALQRRRAMNNSQLADLGLHAEALGLDASFQPIEALADLRIDAGDPVWSVSQIESRFYQGNMLLRDSDVNSMIHGLEIRVPLLDQRVADLAYALPGKIRLPHARADKHLLRIAFADLLRPKLTAQAKRGFTLPIRRWMMGPLREMCEQGLRDLRRSGLLKPQGVDRVWQEFLRDPETPIWSRAFALCVLGLYIAKMGLEV